MIDEDVLHARVPFIARTQQCFAVKAGIDGLLDIARRTFCDTSEGIHPAYTVNFLVNIFVVSYYELNVNYEKSPSFQLYISLLTNIVRSTSCPI